MKRTIAPATLVIAVVTVFVLGIRPRAQADEHRGCSDASLQGSFGFTSIGTLLALPPPFAGPFGGRPSTGKAIPTEPRRSAQTATSAE